MTSAVDSSFAFLAGLLTLTPLLAAARYREDDDTPTRNSEDEEGEDKLFNGLFADVLGLLAVTICGLSVILPALLALWCMWRAWRVRLARAHIEKAAKQCASSIRDMRGLDSATTLVKGDSASGDSVGVGKSLPSTATLEVYMYTLRMMGQESRSRANASNLATLSSMANKVHMYVTVEVRTPEVDMQDKDANSRYRHID